MKILIALLCIAALGACKKAPEEHAHEEHGHDHHDEPSNVGLGFAVQEVGPRQSLRLSEEAIRTLGIQSKPITQDGHVDVPHSAIVHDHVVTGLYRLRDGWFEFVPIDEPEMTDHAGRQMIASSAFKAGDHVVVSGVALLRIAELDVTTVDVEGHSH